MVTGKESQTGQQLSASNSPELNHMALLHLEQNFSLPSFPLSMLTVNAASDIRGLNTGPRNEFGGFPVLKDFSYPTENPYLKDFQFGVTNKPNDASCAPRKRFLIFDQSGDQTRLFVSPSFSPENHIIASKTRPLCEKVPVRTDQQVLVKPLIEEKWDENHFTDGESETLEDTEEIDALLDSDSDDECDNYDNDDDDEEEDDDDDEEVTSSGHTPFSIEKGLAEKELLEEFMEEVASSDGSPKRRKLLDGRFKRSSLVMVESPIKRASSCSYENDDIDSTKRDKKCRPINDELNGMKFLLFTLSVGEEEMGL
ncbi:hypothetical protein BUALT_Bualt15G0063800 [Buddleja alternifolia]|uniref:Uncharacterized protein n=1 Tax=Buddleja alternifolia TaxID=168488 RepID=A0AAV6WID9_9LAMI|nr:hypothetical protein BUALT_Bualt15G0063800 [Buddleja alternifolia]